MSLTWGANLVAQGGFEQQPSSTATSPWYVQGNGGVDRGLGFARTGANNGFVRNNTGWNALKQEVAVTPNTVYTLTGWVKTSSIQPVTFNSGANHSVEVYAGTWANTGDTWLQVDDVAVVRN